MGAVRRRRGTVVYHVIAAVLIAFGIVGILSVGLPFLVCGVLLLALAPYRDRAEILWPPLAAVAAWTAVFAVMSPWGCSSSAGAIATPTGATRVFVHAEICRNAFGARVSSGLLVPASVALVVAVGVGIALHLALARRPRDRVS